MPNRVDVDFEARGTAHHKALYSLFSPRVTLIIFLLALLALAGLLFHCWAAADFTTPFSPAPGALFFPH